MCFFHKWTKWKVLSDQKMSYSTAMGQSGTLREIVQVRECTKCGLKQYKTIDID